MLTCTLFNDKEIKHINLPKNYHYVAKLINENYKPIKLVNPRTTFRLLFKQLNLSLYEVNEFAAFCMTNNLQTIEDIYNYLIVHHALLNQTLVSYSNRNDLNNVIDANTVYYVDQRHNYLIVNPDINLVFSIASKDDYFRQNNSDLCVALLKYLKII